jgi:hypothetical protein
MNVILSRIWNGPQCQKSNRTSSKKVVKFYVSVKIDISK